MDTVSKKLSIAEGSVGEFVGGDSKRDDGGRHWVYISAKLVVAAAENPRVEVTWRN